MFLEPIAGRFYSNSQQGAKKLLQFVSNGRKLILRVFRPDRLLKRISALHVSESNDQVVHPHPHGE
jgi:hypothetical protein